MIALLRLNAGLIWWAAAFALLYAAHGAGCAAGWAERAIAGIDMQRAALLAIWLASVAIAAVIVRILRPQRDGLLPRAGAILAWVGLGATIAAGLPIMLVPSCI